MIKAIETKYSGYRFRSRLEARWAVFFDALGVKWEYEIEGYDLGEDGWYLPDFWLPELESWVEIKPVKNSFDPELLSKLGKLSDHLEQPFLCLSGTPSVDSHDIGGRFFVHYQGFRLFLLAGHRYSRWAINENLGGMGKWTNAYESNIISLSETNHTHTRHRSPSETEPAMKQSPWITRKMPHQYIDNNVDTTMPKTGEVWVSEDGVKYEIFSVRNAGKTKNYQEPGSKVRAVKVHAVWVKAITHDFSADDPNGQFPVGKPCHFTDEMVVGDFVEKFRPV